jgi:N-succinyldiaminopimelate aminotransferase
VTVGLKDPDVPLNPRLDSLSDYPFAQLRALLAEVTPRFNEAPIAMSLGEPQHQPPPLLAETLSAHAGEWNLYPPMAGTPELRAAVAAWLMRRYQLSPGLLSPDRHVLSLSGTKEGLYLAATLAVPQEKAGMRPVVLVPNPYYLVYNGAATMAGAEPVFLDAIRDNDFLPDLARVPAATLARTALCYLCSPANPQGTIASLDYLQQAITLARRYDFVLAIDECYAEIYDDAPPPGGLEACAALGQGLANVLVFHSLSKRSSAPGLRAGFVAGDPELIGRFLHLRNYGGCQLPLPIQAAATALWQDEAHVIENRARYRRKFDIAEAALGGRYGFYRPKGGFYLWLEVGDGERIAVALWREAAIRVLPGGYVARPGSDAVNPGQNYIRLALVHDEPTLETAFARIRRVL